MWMLRFIMSDTNFRFIVVCVALLAIVGGVIDLIMPSEVVKMGTSYMDTLQPELEEVPLWQLLLVVLPSTIVTIASFIGLLLFKRWGRTLYLIGFVLSIPIYCYSGVLVVGPLAQVFMDFSAYGSGFILALCYFSPISVRFSGKVDTDSVE